MLNNVHKYIFKPTCKKKKKLSLPKVSIDESRQIIFECDLFRLPSICVNFRKCMFVYKFLVNKKSYWDDSLWFKCIFLWCFPKNNYFIYNDLSFIIHKERYINILYERCVSYITLASLIRQIHHCLFSMPSYRYMISI